MDGDTSYDPTEPLAALADTDIPGPDIVDDAPTITDFMGNEGDSGEETPSPSTPLPPCPHVDAAFANEAARLSMLKKFKSAVAWSACVGEATSGALGRAAKRRKVSYSSVALYAAH